MLRFLQMSFYIMLAVVIFNGCNGRLFSYKGAVITQQEYMVQLQQGDQLGVWKTNELALNYHYQLATEALKISGTVNLVGGFATGFGSVDRC